MSLLKNYSALLSIALLLFTAACGDKNTVGNASMISGDESKTWKATKQTDASGDKDKLSGDEQKQEMQFFANGSFSMRSPSQNASGKWTYDAMAKSLTLQFVGSEMTENFQVMKLTDDEMTLQGPSGTMELEAE